MDKKETNIRVSGDVSGQLAIDQWLLAWVNGHWPAADAGSKKG